MSVSTILRMAALRGQPVLRGSLNPVNLRYSNYLSLLATNISDPSRQLQPLFSFQKCVFSTATNDNDDDDDDNDDDDDIPELTNIRLIRRDIAQLKKILRKQNDEQTEINKELDKKTGRGWSDSWDLEDMMNSRETYKTLPDWSPNYVSRISMERIQVHPDKIPTLNDLADLSLAPSPPPNPGLGQTKSYALHRKRYLYQRILASVRSLVDDSRLGQIRSLESWNDKQDAVDQLFEEITEQLKVDDQILGRQPMFESWVEKALEQHLIEKQDAETRESLPHNEFNESASTTLFEIDESLKQTVLPDTTSNEPIDLTTSQSTHHSMTSITTAAPALRPLTPVFIDCFGPNDSTDVDIPKILNPLKVYERCDNIGKMIEEWQMSAHKSSKRIMLRHCTQQIAKALLPAIMKEGSESSEASREQSSRVFVTGRQGSGKSAALAAIVASARKSGSIVLYMPDGDRLSKLGYYIVPNSKREGIYDLPILSQHACQQLIDCHADDLESFVVDDETLSQYFNEKEIKENLRDDLTSNITINRLLRAGLAETSIAGPSYAAAVDVLMNQDEKPFLMVFDEFNCYFAPGEYYHGHYDKDVRKPIPYDCISLFQSALNAMSVSTMDLGDYGDLDVEEKRKAPVCFKRGGIVVAITESHAVSRKVTDALILNVNQQYQELVDQSKENGLELNSSLFVVDVPRLSRLEIEHMLSHYEATGVAKLRMDQGETVMNEQEVAYLSMISGGIPQKLLDASIIF